MRELILNPRRMVVLGDVMLDEFAIGRAIRVSPEAPVPVITIEETTYAPGGAANVAANLVSLGANVSLIAVVGSDDSATQLRGALLDRAVGSETLVTDSQRKTTRKVRLVTRLRQHVARFDVENVEPVGAAIEDRLRGLLSDTMSIETDALVLSDYNKGVLSRRLIEFAIDLAKATNTYVLADPKRHDLRHYTGVDVLTPNAKEAESATRITIDTDEAAAAAAMAIQQLTGISKVVITRGESGICVADGSAIDCLPAHAREVTDVTGAGDTVMATLALALANGWPLRAAAEAANLAGSLVVQKFGTAVISIGELSDAIRASEALRDPAGQSA